MNDTDARLAGIDQRLEILGRALTDRLAERDAKIAELHARADDMQARLDSLLAHAGR